MPEQSPFVVVANLLGDPARALMINVMMDGRAHAATELAGAAGISPQTASSHFAKLLAGGLISVETEGRHRRYALANARVAEAVEALSVLAADAPQHRRPHRHILADARTCYDHLAGRLGVALTRALVARGALEQQSEQFQLTASGRRFFINRLGVDVASAAAERRIFARACLDWSEREPHLAGALGAALALRCLGAGWVATRASTRALRVTLRGAELFKREFGYQPID